MTPDSHSYPTPPASAPRWLFWLLPSLRGVETNPLFIKLTGQGFSRPSRFRAFSPPEFKRTRGGSPAAAALMAVAAFAGQALITAYFIPVLIGPNSHQRSSGFMLFFGIVQLILAIIMLAGVASFLIRLANLGGNPPERQFLINASREPWGQDLYLSALSAADVEGAVIGAALWRSFSAISRATAVAFLAAFFLFLYLAEGLSDREVVTISIWSFPVTLTLLFEAFCVSFLRLGISLGSLPSGSRQPHRGGTAASLLALLMVLLLHAPGILIALFVIEFQRDRADPSKYAFELIMGAGVLTCTIACALGLPVAREYFRSAEGNLGRAMQDLVRSDASRERLEK